MHVHINTGNDLHCSLYILKYIDLHHDFYMTPSAHTHTIKADKIWEVAEEVSEDMYYLRPEHESVMEYQSVLKASLAEAYRFVPDEQ